MEIPLRQKRAPTNFTHQINKKYNRDENGEMDNWRYQ